MTQISVARILHIVFLQIAPIVISVIALYFSLRDRHPRLKLQARKGEWYILRKARTKTGENVQFVGILEVYNRSSRANAVTDYQFWYKKNGGWEPMDSERFTDVSPENREETFNDTPAAVASCSGRQLWVAAFAHIAVFPSELDIRVEIEDLFGKRRRTEVTAKF
jgi:hypothetical protein